jgi:putative ABC transport system permease protein
VRVQGTRPGYFDLIDAPVILGRDVSLLDTASSDYPVVIGSDLARSLWGTENPIGKTLARKGWNSLRTSRVDSAELVVVGVYDASVTTKRGMGTRVYTARGQYWARHGLLIRTTGPAQAFVPTLHQFIRTNAPALPVTHLQTWTDMINYQRRDALQNLAGAAVSAGVALLLASIGLFAVVALAVGQRKREIGIRIAVGAEPLRVARMFFTSGLSMCAIGVAIGLPISAIALHIALMEGEEVAAGFSIPMVVAAITAMMFAVAAAATWFPARKAATVDPSIALRAE